MIYKTGVYLSLVVGCLAMVAGPWAGQNVAQDTAAKKNDHIVVKYDKSKDETTVRLKPFALTGLKDERPQIQDIPTHQMDLEISFKFSGKEMTKQVETAMLSFRVTSRNYFFLKGQNLIAVLDKNVKGKDRALQLGVTDYKSDLKFNSVYEEYLTASIPFAALQRMTQAETLDLYVGPVAYTVREKQLEDIRDLGSHMIH
jgi:hypothetical protein